MTVEKDKGLKFELSNTSVWFIYLAVVLALCVVAVFAIARISGKDITLFWSLIPFSGIALLSFYQGAFKVPQNWHWNIEVFGSCKVFYTAGLCFIFPYFNITSYTDVYMGIQELKLFMSEKKGGSGDVEFVGASAQVNITVFYKIVDSIRAAYNVDDLPGGLEEKLDSKVRNFLALYDIEEANKLKAKANLLNILNGDGPDKSFSKDAIPKYSKEDLKKNLFYNELLNDWGVEITDIAISDIELSEELKKARENISIAARAAEEAEYTKKSTVINAQAKNKALVLEGKGYASQVKILTDKGLSPAEAANYLRERLKWENVGTKGATVIVDSGNDGFSGMGTKIAAGMKAINPEK